MLEERKGDVLGYVGPGTYFGEAGSLGKKSRRERTITAMCDSDLAYLRIEDLLHWQEKFPELKRHVDKYGKLLQKLKLPKILFTLIDTDHDGSVQHFELYNVLHKIGKCCADREVNLMMTDDDNIIEPWWRVPKDVPAQQRGVLPFPVADQPSIVDELYHRVASGMINLTGVIVLDGVTNKKYHLDVPAEAAECKHMLVALQASHQLVLNGLKEMDRDTTGTIEYAEFLGWWAKTTIDEGLRAVEQLADDDTFEEADPVDGEDELTEIQTDLTSLKGNVSHVAWRLDNLESEVSKIATQGERAATALDELSSKIGELLSMSRK